MKILLLGGTGFIGTYLLEGLQSYHDVDWTSRSNLTSCAMKYDAEKDSLSQITTHAYDVIINNINPTSMNLDILSRNMRELIAACMETGCHLIHISSILAIEENRKLNSYSEKKAFCESSISTHLPLHSYTILRFPQIFDEFGLCKQSQAGLYFILEKIKKNEPIELFQNYQTEYRNYLPIELLIKIVINVINFKKKGTFNSLIDCFTISWEELINIILQFNPLYDRTSNLKLGNNKCLPIHIPLQSEEIMKSITFDSPEKYFLRAYSNING